MDAHCLRSYWSNVHGKLPTGDFLMDFRWGCSISKNIGRLGVWYPSLFLCADPSSEFFHVRFIYSQWIETNTKLRQMISGIIQTAFSAQGHIWFWWVARFRNGWKGRKFLPSISPCSVIYSKCCRFCCLSEWPNERPLTSVQHNHCTHTTSNIAPFFTNFFLVICIVSSFSSLSCGDMNKFMFESKDDLDA